MLVTCLKPPADSLGSQPRVQLTTYRSDNGIILGRCQAFRHICRTWRGLIQTFFVSTRKEQSCTTNPVHLLKTAQGLHIYIILYYIILYYIILYYIILYYIILYYIILYYIIYILKLYYIIYVCVCVFSMWWSICLPNMFEAGQRCLYQGLSGWRVLAQWSFSPFQFSNLIN